MRPGAASPYGIRARKNARREQRVAQHRVHIRRCSSTYEARRNQIEEATRRLLLEF